MTDTSRERATFKSAIPTPEQALECMTLNGNDLALISFAIGIHIKWYKSQGRSKWVKARIADLEALHAKITNIGDWANPYDHSDDMPLEFGSEVVLRPDLKSVAKIHKNAKIEVGP